MSNSTRAKNADVPSDRDQLMTVYGRKPVLEALETPGLQCQTLHWSRSNRDQGSASAILKQARARNVTVREHSRESLARISRNGKQDQGVALDIHCPRFASLDTLARVAGEPGCRVLALDGITNPQNVGMILRSAAAAGIEGILYPKKGVASLGPLVIKASAGTAFHAPIVTCGDLHDALKKLKLAGFCIATLDGAANKSAFDYVPQTGTVFVLGGETDGVSTASTELATVTLKIPMAPAIESLNVAVTASLIAFMPQLRR